jgi:hypothetical protein
MSTTSALTLAELAQGIRDGLIEVAAADADLTVPALADRRMPDCYPDTTIDFCRAGTVIATVGCWRLGQWMHGPNRQDNGEYIGEGWSWQEDESDGATCGRPRTSGIQTGIKTGTEDRVTWDTAGAPGPRLTLAIGRDMCPEGDQDYSDEVDADIATVQDAIDGAYGEISVSPADDGEVYEAMIAAGRRCEVEGKLEIAAGIGEPISLAVSLYGERDAGRSVYTYAGAEAVWEDRDDMIEAAKAALRKHLNEAEITVDLGELE